jgi:ABC-type multidrug transport system ATPase subunit
MNKNQPAVEAIDVVKQYKGKEHPALNRLSFEINQQEIIGLLGPNGAGKTTLVKILCGVVPATTGLVRVLGIDPTTHPVALKQQIGVVHQRHTFDMFLNGVENLKVAAAFRGLKWRSIKPRVEELIVDFQLQGKCDQPLFTLSGGEQRRIQVIRALLSIPDMLILDEPSAGLDVAGRRRVWALVDEIRKRNGTTIVWTSHYIEELERNCDRVMLIDKGQLVRIGPPAALVGEYGRTRAIIGLSNVNDQEQALAVVRSTGLVATSHTVGIEVEDRDIGGRLPALLSALQDVSIVPVSIQIVTPSLEDAYVKLIDDAESYHE